MRPLSLAPSGFTSIHLVSVFPASPTDSTWLRLLCHVVSNWLLTFSPDLMDGKVRELRRQPTADLHNVAKAVPPSRLRKSTSRNEQIS